MNSWRTTQKSDDFGFITKWDNDLYENATGDTSLSSNGLLH